MVLCKFQGVITFLILGQNVKKSWPIFPHDQYTYNKVWLKSDENWESKVLIIGKLETLRSAPNDPQTKLK